MSQIRRGPGFAHSAEAEQHERAHLGDTLEVAIDVYDAKIVKERRFSNQQIGDGNPMPESVTMGKVSLKPERPFEDVQRSIYPCQTDSQIRSHLVIVAGRSSRYELLQFPYWTEVQRSCELGKPCAYHRISLP